MKKLINILIVSVFVYPLSAFSQGYLGGSVGQADLGESDWSDATSFSIFGGYQFNDYIAVESSYVDFGDSDDGISPVWTVDAQGLDIAAVAMWPITDKFELFARAGFMTWDATLTEAGYGKLEEDSGEDFNYGAGARFNFNEHIGIFVQYQVFNFDSQDVDNLSVGMRYSF